MSEFWTASGLRGASGGSWLVRPAGEVAVSGVSIDSRTIERGEAFVALSGERFDGHAFVEEAVGRGASVLVVERGDALPREVGRDGDVAVIRVGDARRALGRMASVYRAGLEGTRFVAVTGSNGKTTCVRMIDAVLSSRYRGIASRASFNNEIGVPLTVLRARPTDQYVVCEVGMNAPGEIAPLARIVEPDVGVITSIGLAHVEAFDDASGIAREKASMLGFLRPRGVAVVTGDSRLLGPYLRPVANVVTFGEAADADLRLTGAAHEVGDDGEVGLSFEVNGRARFRVPMAGRHNALNAMAAVAVGRRFGLEDDEIAAGLMGAERPPMRMGIERVGGVTVYNDAYNASPESVEAAVRTFSELAAGAARRVVVLGEMLELGEHGPSEHTRAGRLMASGLGIDHAVCVGPLTLFAADALSDGDAGGEGGVSVSVHQELRVETALRIARGLRDGDAVLLKGSRRVGLERVLDALRSLQAAGAGG